MDKRTRSPNYPALSLPEAINRIEMLYKAQHGHAAPREVVAKGIGYNSLNGASATAISALHKYGLLERVGDELKVGERAMRILHPHSAIEKAAAIREAAQEPVLFAELAEKFPGMPPSDEILRNYLLRRNFAPSAVSSVILAYRDTIALISQQAGGLDPYAISIGRSMVPAEAEAMDTGATSPLSTSKQVQNQGDERVLGHWDDDDGGYVRILAGGGISTPDALDLAEALIEMRRKRLKTRTAIQENKEGVVDEIRPTSKRGLDIDGD